MTCLYECVCLSPPNVNLLMKKKVLIFASNLNLKLKFSIYNQIKCIEINMLIVFRQIFFPNLLYIKLLKCYSNY